jgi:hypothetical protein
MDRFLEALSLRSTLRGREMGRSTRYHDSEGHSLKNDSHKNPKNLGNFECASV